VFSSLINVVHYITKLLAVATLSLMVLLLSTRRRGNQSVDPVACAAMPRDFSPSTPTTGLHREKSL